MGYIYILQLQDDKYYIGKTDKLPFNIEWIFKRNGCTHSHLRKYFNNHKSEWLKKYKPVKLIKTIKYIKDYDEHMLFVEYTDKYGIDNVNCSSYELY